MFCCNLGLSLALFLRKFCLMLFVLPAQFCALLIAFNLGLSIFLRLTRGPQLRLPFACFNFNLPAQFALTLY
jgi:hypothetical protein